MDTLDTMMKNNFRKACTNLLIFLAIEIIGIVALFLYSLDKRVSPSFNTLSYVLFWIICAIFVLTLILFISLLVLYFFRKKIKNSR